MLDIAEIFCLLFFSLFRPLDVDAPEPFLFLPSSPLNRMAAGLFGATKRAVSVKKQKHNHHLRESGYVPNLCLWTLEAFFLKSHVNCVHCSHHLPLEWPEQACMYDL